MRRTGTIIALLSLVFLARPAWAQNFSGTYTIQTSEGADTMVIQQDASGSVRGEISMVSGVKVSLKGNLQGNQVLGIATMGQSNTLFRLTVQGNQATYTVIPVADGKPDLNHAQNFLFTRAGGAAAAQPAAASDSPFNGTFQTRPGEGPMTFSIQDDGQGHVTGTLSANNGPNMILDCAIVQSTGAAIGVLKASNGQLTMVQLKPSGGGISLTIAPVGGKLDQGKTFECQRVGGGGGAAGGNPLGGGGATAGSMEGEFSDGNVFLELDDNGGGNYEGQLEFQGKSFPVTGHSSDGTNLKGKFQSGSDNFDFTARLHGSSLTFVTGGTTYHLNREAEQAADTGNSGGGSDATGNAGEAAASGNYGGAAGYGGGGAIAGAADGIQRNPMAPATPGRLSDNNPQSLQWLNALRGKLLTQMSSYSSGLEGGYSSTRRMMLYANGTFEYYSSSSVSVDVGGAFGNSAGQGTQRGTWRIVTANGTSYLALVFQGTMQEDYVELDLRGNTKYVDGRKTFVTNPQ